MTRRSMLGLVAGAVVATTGAGLMAHGLVGRAPRRVLARDPARSVLYVALGDSTVAGVGATAPERNYVSRLHRHLRAVFPRAHLGNLGVSGATAADVVAVQLPRALALRPDLVTVSIGPNDITTGRDVRDFARDLETILRRLTRETAAVVLVNLIPDLALTPRFRGGEHEAVVGRRTVRFNEALGRIARVHGAEVIDLYALSRREVPGRPELIADDGYHPSDAGYARWAAAMWERVAALLH